MAVDGVTTDAVLTDVYNERVRQERLVGKKFAWTAASLDVDHDPKLRILVEEVGEVARAIHEDTSVVDLYEELIQVAAIAVAHAESIRRKHGDWHFIKVQAATA